MAPALLTSVPAEDQATTELDDIEALVLRYRARLLRFVSYQMGGDADAAESIVQDCFVKAYRARASFRGDCSVQSWLTRIALNMVRDQQRTRKLQFWRKAEKSAVDVGEVAYTLPTEASGPEAQLLAREKARQVGEVLKGLSDHQRTAFMLRFTEELGMEEIARTMGMPVSTAKTHLHRAVKAVRAHLGGCR